MRKLLFASCLLLAACGSTTGTAPPAPPTQAQVSADLATAAVWLRNAGCLAAIAGAVAAPIVAVTSDETGAKTLSAVTAAGAAICSTPAPSSVTSPSGTTLGAVVTSPPPGLPGS